MLAMTVTERQEQSWGPEGGGKERKSEREKERKSEVGNAAAV